MAAQKTTHTLSTFSLVMITITCIDSIRNLPSSALFGSSVLFFFVLAGLFFFIPTALICAELSTAWPEAGGVYLWGKLAFGRRFGLLTVWMHWIENVIWYPTILSFIAGTVSYLFLPHTDLTPISIFIIINLTFWFCTIINLFGIKLSARLTEVLGLMGLIVPMILLVTLGTLWFMQGQPLSIIFDWEHLIPDLSQGSEHWFSLSAIILSLTGVELTSVHAAEVRNPKKDYPKSLLISTIFILLTLSLGSLSIAVIVPPEEISLIDGMMTAFTYFFEAYQLPWMIPLIAICLICGAIAAINNWIIGPTKGLLTAAHDGFFPAAFRIKNKHGAPIVLLFIQALIVTILSFVFLFLPTINQSYWLFTVLTTATYMIMYILVFLSFIKLRLRKPDHPRPYKVPGGKIGMWIVFLSGLLSSALTLAISFMPPQTIYQGNHWQYFLLFTSGLVLFCAPPLLIKKRPSHAH